jgi:Zn finger protein HypA/HybF involved in hydrogenase expression
MVVSRYALYMLLSSLCGLQLNSTLLTQETKPFTKADNLQSALNDENHYVEYEDLNVDCPDCFDTMIKIHELDNIRYYCENCDLIISYWGRTI